MKILSFRDSASWQSGLFSGTWLNSDVYADPDTRYPALVPQALGSTAPTLRDGGTLLSSGYATGNGGHAWTVHNRYLTTDQTGDTLTIAVPANTLYLDVVTSGLLEPLMVDRNGNTWTAYAGGAAGQSPPTGPMRGNLLRNGAVMNITVDGVSSSQVDTRGKLILTRILLDGATTHTIVLTHTGTYTGGALTAPDAPRLSVIGLVTTLGSSGGGRTWTSPVLDGGDPLATWLGADWEWSAPGTLTSLQLALGQTPTPDGTWQTYSVPIVGTIPTAFSAVTPLTLGGVGHGRAGFLTLGGTQIKTARYAQVTLTLATALPTPTPTGSTAPWVRHLDIYTSVPQTETLTMLRLPPVMNGTTFQLDQSVYGAQLARAQSDARDLVASYVITSATGSYLQRYGKDLGLPQAPGESQAAYAARLFAAKSGRTTGGTTSYIQAQMSAYIGGTAVITSFGSPGSPWAYTLTITNGWSNPVTSAQISSYLTTFINPAGHIPSIVYV